MAHEKNDRHEDVPGSEGIVNGPPLPEDASSEEEEYAVEGEKVGLNEVGDTVTGDEREIGRTGEGGRDHDSGRDPTLGRLGAPITGASSPREVEEKKRRAG